MSFLILFCIIYSILNSAHAEPIQGDNVRDATDREFPFAVAIIDVTNDIEHPPLNIRQFCTGSLITRKHVLTAEHCVQTKEVEQVEILVGSADLDRCRVYDPETWKTYQEWKYKESNRFPPYYHDVAVITLKTCVYDTNTQYAIVPKFELENLYGTPAKIAGWGLTNNNVNPQILRTVDLTIISGRECLFIVNQLMRRDAIMYDWQVCATSDPWALNDCGDSGGPLLNERNEVIGITLGTCPDDQSISQKFPRQLIFLNRLTEKKINLHASLHYYHDFIEAFTSSDEARDCEL